MDTEESVGEAMGKAVNDYDEPRIVWLDNLKPNEYLVLY